MVIIKDAQWKRCKVVQNMQALVTEAKCIHLVCVMRKAFILSSVWCEYIESFAAKMRCVTGGELAERENKDDPGEPSHPFTPQPVT